MAGKLSTVVGVHGHLNYPGEGELREKAMGIDWMTQQELTQAIPPGVHGAHRRLPHGRGSGPPEGGGVAGTQGR